MKKLLLEKFTDEDFDLYYQLVGNERVMAMITERAIPLEEARKEYCLLLENNGLHYSFGNFKILENSNFIGLAKLEIKERDSKEAELGYMLLPQYWGVGIGSRVAKILIKRAKEDGQLLSVKAIIDPNNIPSRKILINNGFESVKICEIDGLPGEILSMRL